MRGNTYPFRKSVHEIRALQDLIEPTNFEKPPGFTELTVHNSKEYKLGKTILAKNRLITPVFFKENPEKALENTELKLRDPVIGNRYWNIKDHDLADALGTVIKGVIHLNENRIVEFDKASPYINHTSGEHTEDSVVAIVFSPESRGNGNAIFETIVNQTNRNLEKLSLPYSL